MGATWGAGNLLSIMPSSLVYSILFLMGYNRCFAPPDSALSGSAGPCYVALEHAPVQTCSRTIPVASAGLQGKVKSSCFGHPIFFIQKITSSRVNPPTKTSLQKAGSCPLSPRRRRCRRPRERAVGPAAAAGSSVSWGCRDGSGGRLGLLGGLAQRPDVGSLDPYL